MDTILLIISGVLIIGLVWALFLRKSGPPASGSDAMLLLQNQLSELTRVMDHKIGESHKMMSDSLSTQFRESQKLIRDITEELTKVGEGQKQVMNFTEQLQDLQDILKNPKQRGVLGEYYLETLLKNVLPPGSYECQYGFPDGTIVDAAVFVKDKIIPIDSKFSLENYNRLVEEKDPLEKERLEKVFVNDLKNRILETSKYIQPAVGTMDFAFMFIPHEAIYYDLLISKIGSLRDEENENLIQRAASKYKVIIVSPTSFLAYLQTVLQGLNALKIEEKAQDIIANVIKLQNHLKSYEEYHSKLGNTLSTAVNQYNLSGKEFKKVDKDMLRITGDTLDLDLPVLDKPEDD